ncbi:MAG: hypothetical protein HRT57_14165, partial [Crocinitomicaceae bacterium]|nr:hypothetical protein [Crocinitomicaceae bacterium]
MFIKSLFIIGTAALILSSCGKSGNNYKSNFSDEVSTEAAQIQLPSAGFDIIE